MEITKQKIEELAFAIMEFLKIRVLDEGVMIYYNELRMDTNRIHPIKYNPHDYCDYAPNNHILSMTFEGLFNSVMNMNLPAAYCNEVTEQFDKLLNSYGVYHNMGNSWNLSVYPCDDTMKVEYTQYEDKERVITIHQFFQPEVPVEIYKIISLWQACQTVVGDKGSCVIGAGYKFNYNGATFFMTPCSVFQGCLSWEKHRNLIKDELIALGATNIKYSHGVMD